MSPSKRARWVLDPAEVDESWNGSNRGRRGRAGQSRALDITAGTIALRHRPTGLEARGSIPPGHYSRVLMKQLKADLHCRLFADLKRLVAAHLRIPGR